MSENTSGSIDGNPEGTVSDDKVAFTTYRKVLTEKKNMQEKMRSLENQLDEFNQEKQSQEQRKLEEQGEFKKILELRSKELEAIKSDNQTLANELTTTWKKQAFFSKLGTDLVDPVYEQHIPLDQIIINPETQKADTESVDAAINLFREQHSHLLKRKDAPKLPANAPNTNFMPKPVGSLTNSERETRLTEALTTLITKR